MSESVRQDLPATQADDHIAFRISAEQILVIRKAAELIGWTVTDYVLSTALDRAERDLYEHAAAVEAAAPADTDPDSTDPYVALLLALT
ncbi:type II toxin -antitoxin system TacA 1-like antitoxin [Actinomadura sp. 3N407]|uniref:type II toxin -antitoxin system TacA 1-like antitoxin n=1 Tax=Actinomadura sp. 3N407 TaxID=3457423 RepID=UPI003FCE3B79